MATLHGIVTAPGAPGNVRVAPVEPPVAQRGEALVRVAATSLNRGELRMAGQGAAGRRLGWDFAGIVEAPAADGTGPAAGARVVGMLPTGAWAESIAVPVEAMAVLPEAVGFAAAATLPVAGLTALYGLEKSSGLLGRRVLVTGGTGGVGHFGIQLAALGGARVVATARTEAGAAVVRAAGAHEVIVGDDPAALGARGRFDLVLDGVGGPLLGAALGHLARDGVCVIYGATAGAEVRFDARALYSTGGARVYGFILFHELRAVPASVGLARLAALVAAGTLHARVDLAAPLAELPAVAQRLLDRDFTGKAVVTF